MTATLNMTEKQLLELSLTQVKSKEFRILEVERKFRKRPRRTESMHVWWCVKKRSTSYWKV